MAREFTQEHIMKICLPPELYLAVIKFQVEKEIGKSYAELLLLTKATYQKQLITREDLREIPIPLFSQACCEEQPQKLTSEQQKEKQKMDEKARTFSSLISQCQIRKSPQQRD